MQDQPMPPRDFTNPVEKEITELQQQYSRRLKDNKNFGVLIEIKEKIKTLKSELSLARGRNNTQEEVV